VAKKFALSEASRLIAEIKPSIIISSHEPPVTLEVGLACAGRVPWLVDLGDPVLAPYTPARWRSYARRLEAAVCESAGLISATTEATRQLLIKRHGVEPEKIFVLTQGYDDALPVDLSWEPPRVTKERWLELLYTGRFYAFRDPTALLEAVLLQDRVRLTIIAPEISESHKRLVARSEGRIVYMGEQSHSTVLESQRHCDVLVNIGNDLEAQSPGKLFEYFGSGKPILHCYSRNDDPSVGLLEDLGRGWSCRNATGEIASLLQQMVSPPYVLFSSLSDKREVLEVFGWSRIALQLKQRCEHLVETAKHVSARRRPI
jgi:glycosyltransferase involved in cell wall biosynthesis